MIDLIHPFGLQRNREAPERTVGVAPQGTDHAIDA
ncbi:hypothetical protein SPICUR_03940 [Spiribacter curvatus]|uniref:Uncharacterized protein n=1 Tax=Spiribacter curvatus TaxID=1335757 RepID=U5T2W9_9GAMM|nr:hypothetical protein SPICUR_03940 [Spiribacter curvatus]